MEQKLQEEMLREYKNPKEWNEIKQKYNVSSVQEFIDLLNKNNNNFPARKNYQMFDQKREQKKADYKKNRMFLANIGEKERIVPENAIKFHLVENNYESLGDFFAYEFPYLQTNANGGIDLISYKDGKINFIELKSCKMKGLENRKKDESHESLLKATIEIATYYSYIYNLQDSDFEVFKQQLEDKFSPIKEIEFKKEDIVLCVLVSKQAFEKSKLKDKEVFKEIMELKNFKFYYIEQANNVENLIDKAYLGTKEKLFEIQEYKKI